MAIRSVRNVGGITNTLTGNTSPDTIIISNPVHADFKPWLNKKRQVVHVNHQYGTMSGQLISYGRGMMTVRMYAEGYKYGYVIFAAKNVSEISITGNQQPNIRLHSKREY